MSRLAEHGGALLVQPARPPLRGLLLAALAFSAATAWTLLMAEYIFGPVGMYLAARGVWVRVRAMLPLHLSGGGDALVVKRGPLPARRVRVRAVHLRSRERGVDCTLETAYDNIPLARGLSPEDAHRLAAWVEARSPSAAVAGMQARP
jgi:hypothetical protein